jgi:hypothetical protein
MNVSTKVFEVFYEVVKDRFAWVESHEENYKEALKAAISQYEFEKWQPIETCPIDNVVDLFSTHGFRYTAMRVFRDYPSPPYNGQLIANDTTDIKNQKPITNFSHWMHIPQPPKEA